jgi:hypothetical protein
MCKFQPFESDFLKQGMRFINTQNRKYIHFSVENFLYEVSEVLWLDFSCLLLSGEIIIVTLFFSLSLEINNYARDK